jgi:hypothetical protein
MHGNLLCALVATGLGLGAAALSPVQIVGRPSFRSAAASAVCVAPKGNESRLGQCPRAQRTTTAAVAREMSRPR